jgi:glycerophosphoryl diester phosphodiesterase
MTTNPWLRAERPLVIAHRGHSIALPENTIEAYRRAVELGVEMIECDVNITRDGELVMIHDWTLDRTTSGSGPVRALTLDEVRSLDAGSRFGPEFAGLRVPTAAETIELAREAGILMCFEVKGATPEESHEIGESLADLLARSDALDWAFMSGYDHAALAAARARVPELLLAPERLPDDVPPDPIDAVRQASGLGAPVLQNHWQFLTPDLIATLHDAGVAVWAWPTTDPDSIELSIAAGVDGLMGDDVDAIVRAVAGLEVGRP